MERFKVNKQLTNVGRRQFLSRRLVRLLRLGPARSIRLDCLVGSFQVVPVQC
jgi:hypothetical protein